MKTIIFGGSGFIGSYIGAELDKQKERYINCHADLTRCEIKNVKKIMSDGDSVVMLAALTQEHGEAYDLTARNVLMATNVIKSMEGKHIEHVIYVSSDSVYGNPDSLYGHMHLVRERMFAENCKSLTILRPCAIYGKGDTHNAYGINSFVKEAREKGTITLFGDGEEKRSNIYVQDVALIISEALRKKPNDIYNLNCGKLWTFKEIANIIQYYIPCEIKSKDRTKPVYHRNFDNSNLVRDFFSPRTAEAGIKEMIGAAS